MTGPLGVDDFFVLEAGEYLERLSSLLATPAPPADELVRFTRALRGSALMANQHAIARAAGGLEGLVRGFREGRRGWDAATADLASNAVREIRALLARVREWSDEDTVRADRLANALQAATGGSPSPTIRPAGPADGAAADAGVRAFVAREGAVVASALDQAARSLRSTPNAPDPLQAVLRRMQPLRGLAALTDFPPLPELLEGVERAIADLNRAVIAAETVGDLFEAAAKALSRAARDVAQHGRPAPDAEELRHFADILLQTRKPEVGIVPIESLFFEDAGPGILQRGTAPRAAPPSELGRVELVSRGEHLCQVAHDLERMVSSTQRDLRLHALAGDLRSLAEGVTGPLAASLGDFARRANEMIATGVAALSPREFAGRLRQAGELLRSFSSVDEESRLTGDFTSLGRSLQDLGSGAAPAPGAPAESAFDEREIVPIESLLHQPEAPTPAGVVADSANGASADAVERDPLAGSYASYARLISERGLGPASLASLLAGSKPPQPQPTHSPLAPPAPPGGELDIIDIAELCYRGRAALQRAALVKLEIRSALSASAPATAMQPLLDELLDLVELALIE